MTPFGQELMCCLLNLDECKILLFGVGLIYKINCTSILGAGRNPLNTTNKVVPETELAAIVEREKEKGKVLL